MSIVLLLNPSIANLKTSLMFCSLIDLLLNPSIRSNLLPAASNREKRPLPNQSATKLVF